MEKRKKDQIRPGGSFSIEERREIIRDYLTSNLPKTEIWKKYTGQDVEHGHLARWMRQLGMAPNVRATFKLGKKIGNFSNETLSTVKVEEKEQSPEELKMRIKELEDKLETAQLKVEGYEIMIEIAEKELNVPIRKKSGTK